MRYTRLLTLAACLATLTAVSACGVTLPTDPPADPSASPDANTSTTVDANASVEVKLPDPTEIATFTNFKAVSCDQEASLKSSTGAASNIVVNNETDATIKLYWLDFNGKRVEYSRGGIKAGATHRQSTFVTHPWVITNANEECLGIYIPESSGSATLNVNQTVDVVGSASGALNTDISAEGITRQQFINLMQCYKQKLPAGTTASVDVILANVNLIPDSAFAGATFALQIQQARAAGCVI